MPILAKSCLIYVENPTKSSDLTTENKMLRNAINNLVVVMKGGLLMFRFTLRQPYDSAAAFFLTRSVAGHMKLLMQPTRLCGIAPIH